jgi:nicotinamide-nucleotide amidase
MKSEIIAVGSEMLTPFRQDTNSLYLTEKLNEIGVTVAFKTIVGDRQQRPRQRHPHRPRPALTFSSSWAASAPPKTTSPAKPSPKRSVPQSAATPSSSPPCTPAPPPGASHALQQPQAGRRPRGRNRPAPTPTAPRPASGSTPPFNGHRKLIMLVPGPPSECKPLFDDECLPRLREIVPRATSPSAPSAPP